MWYWKVQNLTRAYKELCYFLITNWVSGGTSIFFVIWKQVCPRMKTQWDTHAPYHLIYIIHVLDLKIHCTKMGDCQKRAKWVKGWNSNSPSCGQSQRDQHMRYRLLPRPFRSCHDLTKATTTAWNIDIYNILIN